MFVALNARLAKAHIANNFQNPQDHVVALPAEARTQSYHVYLKIYV
jgi:hypothetical protein